MPYYHKLVGKRLYLSPLDTEDPEVYTRWAEWLNEAEVAEHFSGSPQLVTIGVAQQTLASLQGYRMAMVLVEGDLLIGQISLHDVDYLNRNAFMGIVIGEAEHRHRGYGAEAIRLLLAYAFNTLNLHSVMLSVHADNYPAIA